MDSQRNGHSVVDLGLPSGLLWARCNIGAVIPEDFGEYYAWGEIKTKSRYDYTNSETYKVDILEDITGNPKYDVARAKWGGYWRMPTEADFSELLKYCTCEKVTLNGVDGCKVTGKNGNSIFFPFAGYCSGDDVYDVEYDFGYYWTSTPYSKYSDNYNAYSLNFIGAYGYTTTDSRDYGYCIRSVYDESNAIYSSSGSVNGYEFVDLGLSVKWAKYNVGAKTPEGYGGYYAWGEIEEKESYGWSTYRWSDGSDNTITKYCVNSSYGSVDDKVVLDPDDDVAQELWGAGWRMPTKAEQDELREKCKWEWVALNGKNGYRVASEINGNSIFLPAAGDFGSSKGSWGYYWSGSLYDYTCDAAYCLYFFNGSYDKNTGYSRSNGFSVRPVIQ